MTAAAVVAGIRLTLHTLRVFDFLCQTRTTISRDSSEEEQKLVV